MSNFNTLVEDLARQAQAKKLSQLFVTGTDTDVGKTYISAKLLQALAQQLPTTHLTARKPIASGCRQSDDGTLVCEDVEQLWSALQTQTPPPTRQEICPYRFELPIAPQTALQQAGLTVTTQQMAQNCQTQADFTLIEGAGGFYSPLSSDGLNADLAKSLKSPVLLVVKDQLGCINHTLLTVNAIQQAQLPIVGIVLNQNPDDSKTMHQLKQQPLLTDIPLYQHPKN
jgi:dethiobiotin synthetase